MNLIKKCKVCGDAATGFNYKGLSCESCKVFFHRNWFRYELINCKKFGHCPINLSTRRKCTKCRLEKCFQIGMRRKSTNVLEEIQNFSNLDHQIAPNFTPAVQLLKCPSETPFSSRRYAMSLNDYEEGKICEILKAVTVFVDETKIRNVRPAKDLYDGWGTPEIYVKMTIKFCKQIAAFNFLNSQDKLSVLKDAVMEMLSIRFAFLINFERGGFPMSENEQGTQAIFVTYDLLENIPNKELLKENHRFTRSLHDEMENDVQIRDLLLTYMLFHQDSNVSCPEFMRYHHALYSRLLRRYLEHKYKNVYHANRKYCALMRLVKEFKQIRQNERELFAEMDAAQIPHIYIDLYDLH